MLGYCFTTELYAQSPSFILNTVYYLRCLPTEWTPGCLVNPGWQFQTEAFTEEPKRPIFWALNFRACYSMLLRFLWALSSAWGQLGVKVRKPPAMLCPFPGCLRGAFSPCHHPPPRQLVLSLKTKLFAWGRSNWKGISRSFTCTVTPPHFHTGSGQPPWGGFAHSYVSNNAGSESWRGAPKSVDLNHNKQQLLL